MVLYVVVSSVGCFMPGISSRQVRFPVFFFGCLFFARPEEPTFLVSELAVAFALRFEYDSFRIPTSNPLI